MAETTFSGSAVVIAIPAYNGITHLAHGSDYRLYFPPGERPSILRDGNDLLFNFAAWRSIVIDDFYKYPQKARSANYQINSKKMALLEFFGALGRPELAPESDGVTMRQQDASADEAGAPTILNLEIRQGPNLSER